MRKDKKSRPLVIPVTVAVVVLASVAVWSCGGNVVVTQDGGGGHGGQGGAASSNVQTVGVA